MPAPEVRGAATVLAGAAASMEVCGGDRGSRAGEHRALQIRFPRAANAGRAPIMLVRLTKVFFALAIGLFALLVAADNVIDYGTNYAFVQHVFSMDTIFPDSRLTWRAIRNPVLWQAGYWLIILGEALTALLFLAGAMRLLSAVRAPAEKFEAAKAWVVVGAGIGFAVWFVGFMLVGGEWFQMWQSSQWNGQQSAFRFYVTILLVLVFINQPDRELR